jgi:hypothetical protein
VTGLGKAKVLEMPRSTDNNWPGTGWAHMGLAEGEVKVLGELGSTDNNWLGS